VNLTLLSLGFLIGMQHALETDHLAAVASLATRGHTMGDAIRQGATWGIGHTLTLLFFGSLVLFLDTVIPRTLAAVLEFMVGLMLLGLGIDVLRRLLRDRIHFHRHVHADGTVHLHAHSHSGDCGHPTVHRHDHRRLHPFSLRALLVGMMHGMAGSAALIVLTLQAVRTPLSGIAYIALFGIGSIAGMALLSVIIAVPLRYTAHSLTRIHDGLQATVGIVTVVIGSVIVYDVGIAGGLFA
jgi:ABC-type nickel/cobalt efflux system permease component RcnA